MHSSFFSSALLLLGALSQTFVRGNSVGGSLESLRHSQQVAFSEKRYSEGRPLEGRVLRAARLKSGLSLREVQDTLRHDHILHYLDGKYTSVAWDHLAKMCPLRRVQPRDRQPIRSPGPHDRKSANVGIGRD